MLAEFIQLPKEGETVGPYLLRKTLSTSILGTFFIATHKGIHEDVLIHIIPEALLRADSRFQARYRENIERQKRLPPGPALAAVDCNRIAGNLVVQYEGGNYRSLNDVVLRRKEPLPAEAVRRMLHSIAKGLSDALKLEQGHYFMTPDFLFLDQDGEIRIAGIGLFQSIHYEYFERFVSGAVIPIQIDKSKRFNAIEILSPEIRNFKSRDQRSDFYCIGMCAYFMLTGYKPERRWTLPSKVREDIDDGWDLFISHCLESRPADRFPHYRAFIRDLDNLEDLTGKPRRESGKLLRPLHRIPLPQAIENMFGMRTLLFLRLGLLGLAGVLAVGTASLLYQIIFSDLDFTPPRKPLQPVSNADKANLVLQVSPPNALLQISGPQSGRFIVQDKALMLRGRTGRYTLDVSAPSRRPVKTTIELDSGETLRRHIILQYRFAPVRVEGVVGTEVYVETAPDLPIHVGTISSEEGLDLDERFLAGEYVFIGRHPGYLPARSESIQLEGGETTVTFQQKPRPTELVVLSDPPGARVSVDGSPVGLTPLRIEGVESGREVRVHVEKEGHRPVAETLSLDKGEQVRLDFGQLVEQVGFLSYSVLLPTRQTDGASGFTLTVDGESHPLNADESLRLPVGSHTLKLEHPDYFPLQRTFSLSDGESRIEVLQPEPRPVRIRPVLPEERTVRFRVGEEAAQLDEDGFLRIPAFEPVRVEAIIRDFHDVVQVFEGGANELRQWEIPLKPLPAPVKGSDYTLAYFDIHLVWVEPTRFRMGSPIDEFRRLPNEDNRTTVRLTYGYWIGQREIDQEAYLRIMGSNPSRFSGGSHPVDSVTWHEAVRFCERLTEFERNGGRLPDGYAYRLPTEAEWELAARAETDTPFSFGTMAGPEDGNFHGTYEPGVTAGRSAERRYGTLPTGSFPANPWGLHDVHGNVAEWTLDRYWDRLPGGLAVDPVNLERGRGRTVRGGSWRDSADRVRTAARRGAPADTSSNAFGFRVVLGPVLREQPE